MSGLTDAKVISQERLSDDIYRLTLDIGASEARPGQFLNLYVNDGAHILPRPISVCDVREEGIVLVYRLLGSGTKSFSKLKPGDHINVLGPLGNGFPLDDLKGGERILAVGGGIGIPPMLYLGSQLKKLGLSVEAVLGYRDEGFLEEDFERLDIPVHKASDTGNTGIRGTVIDAIISSHIGCDIIFACGPIPMLRAIRDYASANNIRAYVSLEERMACGIGACLGCVCRTVDIDEHSGVHNRRVCADGPVFDVREVSL